MSLDYKNSNNHQPLIHLDNISKTYKNAAGSFAALNDINLDFYKGEFVGVIGKSGSGKSTLVNMMTGIDRPTKGRVLVEKRDIHAMKESKQARWRGLNMGVVFQFFQLLPMLSLVENVLLPMDFCEKYDPEVRYDRAMELLTLVGLQDVAHKLPGSVSGGQQQSAAIARALANDPPIIVADEPTGNLDARTAETVYDKFESLANEGRTIIMITHDQEIEPRLSRKILISDGEVIDPTLIHTFPWLPHSSLKVLNHALRRMTYQQGENLDITGDLADQLMMIEEGKILLSYRGRFRKSKTANLTEGNYFVGPNIIEDEHLRQYQAKVLTETTTVAILSWDVLAPEVQIVTKGPHKLQEHLRRQMLGEAIENHERKEMIQ